MLSLAVIRTWQSLAALQVLVPLVLTHSAKSKSIYASQTTLVLSTEVMFL